GVLAGGNELFDAIENEIRSVRFGPGRNRGGVRSRMRLAQAETSDLFALRKRLEILFLLRLASEGQDRPADDRVLDAQYRRRRAVARGDLLERDGERHIIQPRPAVYLGDDHAARAEPGKLGKRLAREHVLSIPSRGRRGELLSGERPHGVAHHLLRLIEQHTRDGFRRNAFGGVCRYSFSGVEG